MPSCATIILIGRQTMRELRLVFGWLIQIVGMLLFPAMFITASSAGLIVIIGNALASEDFALSTIEWVKLFSPTFAVFISATFLTWLGLRLRRDL